MTKKKVSKTEQLKIDIVEITEKSKTNLAERIRDTIHAAKRNLGRPIVNQEQGAIASDCRRQEFLRHFFASSGNVSYACTVVGVSRSTFTHWKLNYPEFREAVEEVNEALLDIAEQQLIENIQSGKETSLIFFLCNRGKNRGYQDVRKIENKVTVPIQINVEYADDRRKKVTAKTSPDAGEPEELSVPVSNEEKN